MIDVKEEQIKLLCKQLKLPTFANYRDILRQSRASADFSDLLLDLLMAETSARQENQNRRRLKAAGFPFQKTLDEFDFSWLNPSISPVFIHYKPQRLHHIVSGQRHQHLPDLYTSSAGSVRWHRSGILSFPPM